MQKRVLGGLLLLGCSQAFAVSHNIIEQPIISPLKRNHIFFQIGGFRSNQGKSQHILAEGLIGDNFTVTRTHGSNTLVGLGYFIDGQNISRAQLSYGINAFYLPKTSVIGTVVQEDIFTNLSYYYHLIHYPIYAAIKAKVDLTSPYLSLTFDVGSGPNFMRAGGFTEHSLDGGITLSDKIFSGHTTTTFSATAGIGIQLTNVFGSIPLEFGYRFFYLGQGHFTKNNSQLVNSLHSGSVSLNALICTVHI